MPNCLSFIKIVTLLNRKRSNVFYETISWQYELFSILAEIADKGVMCF